MVRWGVVLIFGLCVGLSWALWGAGEGAAAADVQVVEEDVYTLGGGFWSGPPSGRAIGAEGSDDERDREPLTVSPVDRDQRGRFRCIHAE